MAGFIGPTGGNVDFFNQEAQRRYAWRENQQRLQQMNAALEEERQRRFEGARQFDTTLNQLQLPRLGLDTRMGEAQMKSQDYLNRLQGQRFGLEQQRFGLEQQRFGAERDDAGYARQADARNFEAGRSDARFAQGETLYQRGERAEDRGFRRERAGAEDTARERSFTNDERQIDLQFKQFDHAVKTGDEQKRMAADKEIQTAAEGLYAAIEQELAAMAGAAKESGLPIPGEAEIIRRALSDMSASRAAIMQGDTEAARMAMGSLLRLRTKVGAALSQMLAQVPYAQRAETDRLSANTLRDNLLRATHDNNLKNPAISGLSEPEVSMIKRAIAYSRSLAR